MDVVSADHLRGQPEATMQQALEAMALIRSVYAASTLGRPVLFADVLTGKYDDVELAPRHITNPA